MVRWLWRTGLRRGILGGSRPWFAVAVAAGGLRLLRRLSGREPEVVFSQELPPGATLVISHGTENEPEVLRRPK